MATAQHEIPVTRLRALIVDDSQIARYVLCGQLMRLGFDVDAANSAESALKQLTGPLPDVVFMDHLLPGMNGLEAVRRLRSQPRFTRVPIVMYTAQDTVQFAERSRECGADDIYVKTEDESALAAILHRLDLIREEAQSAEAGSNVLPLRGTLRPQDAVRTAADPAEGDLSDLLEPMMDTHYEKLRRDLLAEFAILERYEERMRHDLFSRVESLTRHAVDRLDRSLHQSRSDQQDSRGPRWLGALAAGTLLALAAGLAAALGVYQRIGELEAGSAAAVAALESQVTVLQELNASLGERAAISATAEPVPSPPVPSEDDIARPMEAPPTAVSALVAELQGMGILGSVRIETNAGSFCVGSTPTGFRMEASGQALDDCEVLPLLMSAANW